MASQQDQASPGDRPPSGPVSPQAMPGPVPPDPAPAGPGTGGPVPAGPGRAPGTGQSGATTILKSAWRTLPDGRTVFRLMPPLVLWWIWVAFAVLNVADLAIQSHSWFSLQVTGVIGVVTALMYACTLRPKVISDAAGLTVRNPFRDYRVPWGGVAGIYLGDSVEIQCERPAPRDSKTVYSWALYSPRRSRARAELRAGTGARKWRERHDVRAQRRYEVGPGETWESSSFRTPSFARMPDKAKELSTQHPSHVMAAELARRCDAARNDAARNGGVSGGIVQGQWAWLPIAVVLLAVAFLIAVTAVH